MNNEKQKTIFISSFYGLIGRNILSTNFLKKILDNSVRVVILLPQEKVETYRKIFGSENVFVEGVSYKEGIVDKFFSQIFFSLSDVQNAKINRIFLIDQGKYINAFFSWILSTVSHAKLIRQFFRFLDYKIIPKNNYKQYFEKYKPDLVFATDIFRHQDVNMMREARSRKVLTVGMVRSWDNVSTKGLNRFIPDKVVVHADKIKEEIIKHGDVNLQKICTVGVPHYDYYNSEGRAPREVFFKKLNLDPNKKTLLLSPPLRSYTSDPIAETIVKALESFNDIQVVIRMTLVGKSNIGSLKPIPNKLAIDAPESANSFDHADVIVNDDHLTDLLYHCDAIASHVSTLAIDAVVFDKPALYVGFNTKPTSYRKGIRWFFDLDCARDLISTGGIKLANNIDEFMGQLLQYFADKNKDKDGRKKIIDTYCFRLDGKSSERLAKVILDTLFFNF